MGQQGNTCTIQAIQTGSEHYCSAADQLISLLDAAEQRHAQQQTAQRRAEFVVTRGTLRQLLAEHTTIPVDAWSFMRDTRGRLHANCPTDLLATASIPDINISHTHGLVVVGVCSNGQIGVDAENAQRQVRHQQLADRFFTTNEQQWLAQQHEPREAFLELWTIKEAYLKAMGTGIAHHLPFAEFEQVSVGDVHRTWQWTAPAGHPKQLKPVAQLHHQKIGDFHLSYALTDISCTPELVLVS